MAKKRIFNNTTVSNLQKRRTNTDNMNGLNVLIHNTQSLLQIMHYITEKIYKTN